MNRNKPRRPGFLSSERILSIRTCFPLNIDRTRRCRRCWWPLNWTRGPICAIEKGQKKIELHTRSKVTALSRLWTRFALHSHNSKLKVIKISLDSMAVVNPQTNGIATSSDWPGRYFHIDQVLDKPGPRTDPAFLAGNGVRVDLYLFNLWTYAASWSG